MIKFLVIILFPALIFSQSSVDVIEDLIRKKEYNKAQNELNTYLKTTPKTLKAIELQGDIYGYKKQWDKAIETYKALVDANPHTANYHYKYGGVLGMKALSVNKMKALALIPDLKASFIKAAELDSKHIEARWALVELFMQLPALIGGSKSTALKYANQLENLSKVDGYLAKGYIYEYDDDPKQAEKFYKQAVQVGGSVTYYNKLSTFYKNEKQLEKAVATLEEALTKHGHNIFNYQIGKISADYTIKLDKGVQYLHTFIKNHSAKDEMPIEWAYYRLAQIYKHKKDKAKALEYIDKALGVRFGFKEAVEEREVILGM